MTADDIAEFVADGVVVLDVEAAALLASPRPAGRMVQLRSCQRRDDAAREDHRGLGGRDPPSRSLEAALLALRP